MCGFCAGLAGHPHWTVAPREGETYEPDSRARWLLRHHRLLLVNAVCAAFGCKVEDWASGQYVVRGSRGQVDIVDALPQVWQVVERIAGCAIDPLDPALLARLSAHVP